jgi:excisionase family DNA binding protein
MTVRETAAYLGISRQSVYLLCASGKLPHYRMGVNGGRVVIDQEQADAYRLSCVRGGPPASAKPKPRPYVPQCL